MTPEASLRQILAELLDRLENTATWARLALAVSEREGQPPEEQRPRGGRDGCGQ